MWFYLVSCLVSLICLLYFFFFKQKTAYEMRISDWSSDVCSSDLQHLRRGAVEIDLAVLVGGAHHHAGVVVGERVRPPVADPAQIGRASCRERVCQYV